MPTKLLISRLCSTTAAAALLFTAACESPAGLRPEDGPLFNAGAGAHAPGSDQLKAARRATARFHSETQALQAGYVPDDHCVAVPGLGGMGFHWVNPDLIDPVFDPSRPEVVLYAPGENGQTRLVAVEYVVIDIGQARPTMAGHAFDIGGVPPLAAAGVPHWSLHVWLYEDNPNGIFTPFNPNVSCG